MGRYGPLPGQTAADNLIAGVVPLNGVPVLRGDNHVQRVAVLVAHGFLHHVHIVTLGLNDCAKLREDQVASAQIVKNMEWMRDRRADMEKIAEALSKRDQVIRYLGRPEVRESDGENVFYVNTGRKTDPKTGKYGYTGGSYSMKEILDDQHIKDALKEATYEW